ncbi:hypothetical protein MKX42_20665 [Paenibacillus sp. FSL R7-0204]|uniref:hypothetical protein n=1 Tax=Paenibacillus sp. FSL R7-0204 TaxID=2921675 RepID=UPI0030F4B69C
MMKFMGSRFLICQDVINCTLREPSAGYDEIAAALDIPLGTAKSRHHKALRQNVAFTADEEMKGEWTCLPKVN